jgi:hypothetical protein
MFLLWVILWIYVALLVAAVLALLAYGVLSILGATLADPFGLLVVTGILVLTLEHFDVPVMTLVAGMAMLAASYFALNCVVQAIKHGVHKIWTVAIQRTFPANP